MDRIANSLDFQAKLQEVLAYAQTPNPFRKVLASKLSDLAAQVSSGSGKVAASGDVDSPMKKLFSALSDAENDLGQLIDDLGSDAKGASEMKQILKCIERAQKAHYELAKVLKVTVQGR